MDIPEENINEILDNNPSLSTLHTLLPILMEEGKLKRVIQECRKSLSRFPEDYIIHKILAEAYFADGQFLEAETEVNFVIKGIEKLTESYLLKADILLGQKREREAVDPLKQFIAFFPEDKKALSILNSIQDSMKKDAEGESRDIEDEPGEIIQEESDTFPEIITATLAETYYSQGKIEDAVDIYNKLIQKNPEDTFIRERLDELIALIPGENNADPGGRENRQRKKEQIITILNTWRNSFREGADTELTVH